MAGPKEPTTLPAPPPSASDVGDDRYAQLAERFASLAETQIPFLRAQVTSLSEEIHARAPTPLPNPDLTPTGSVRFDPEVWKQIVARFESMETARVRLEDEAKIKEAETRGAKRALAELETSMQVREAKLMTWVKLLTAAMPVVAAAAAIITHFLK